jgi:hypothetical protein
VAVKGKPGVEERQSAGNERVDELKEERGVRERTARYAG